VRANIAIYSNSELRYSIQYHEVIHKGCPHGGRRGGIWPNADKIGQGGGGRFLLYVCRRRTFFKDDPHPYHKHQGLLAEDGNQQLLFAKDDIRVYTFTDNVDVVLTIHRQKTSPHTGRLSSACTIPATEDCCPAPTASAPSVFPATVLKNSSHRNAMNTTGTFSTNRLHRAMVV